MKICGFDLSMNSSGIVKLELDDNLEIISTDYLGFTQVKKHESDKVSYFKKDSFGCRYDITNWMIEKIQEFGKDCEYIAIEDYAYGANGTVFDIAEFGGSVKMMVFNSKKNMRLYDPGSIKKFATGKGNVDKISMWKAFESSSEVKPDIKSLPEPTTGKGISPTSDIIDAYWIARLLRDELRLRKGIISLRELSEEKISIFNRVSKSQPQNLLDTEFILKK